MNSRLIKERDVKNNNKKNKYGLARGERKDQSRDRKEKKSKSPNQGRKGQK